VMLACTMGMAACDAREPAETASARATATPGKPAGLHMPLSEYSGTIRHIVIHQPEGQIGAAWRAVHDLLKAMPEATFTLVCNSRAAIDETIGRLRQWELAQRANIRILPVEGPLLVWARDRYIAMRPTGGDALPVWLTPTPPASFDAERR